MLKVEQIEVNGPVTIRFWCSASRSYTLLYRDTMGAPQWTSLTNIPATTAAGEETRFIEVVDPQAAGVPQRLLPAADTGASRAVNVGGANCGRKSSLAGYGILREVLDWRSPRGVIPNASFTAFDRPDEYLKELHPRRSMPKKSKAAEPMVIERTFNAPIGTVWKAITNKAVMKRWYFDLKEFKPEVGFEFQFVVEHEGVVYDHRCRVTKVIPQKMIAYTWRYEGYPGDSLVTFELFPEGDKTRLRLTHNGLETFPALPGFAPKNFKEGWTQIIGTSLKEFLEAGGNAAKSSRRKRSSG